MEESQNFKIIENKYKIITKIGEGQYSKVYLAEDQMTKKKYAIKVLEEGKKSDLEKEVSILFKVSQLNNPYIINLMNYGKENIKNSSSEKSDYIILEYALNGDIFDYIKATEKGLEEIYAKFIFKKILEGVQAIHKSGICHRDLKMNNILLDEFYNPKICDFGFATETQGKNGLPKKLTQYLGTPNYAAPEMYDEKPYDGIKADIFSLGVILLNIVICNIGFKDANIYDHFYKYIIYKLYDDYWKIVEEQIGQVPKQVKKLYERMVAYNPDERPSSIKEILDDPWMKEVDLKGEEYKKLEQKVKDKFVELEKTLNKKNETINTNNNFNTKINLGENKDLSDEFEKEYFNLNLTPKYILKTGLNMKHYIKINGNINPAGFMNCLANEIKKKYEDRCKIEENEQKLKFRIIFENSEEMREENQNENNEKLKEEFKNLEMEKSNDDKILIERKESIIQIKLFESINGGYIIRFAKKQGEIEDFHKNLANVKKIIKNIL